MQFVSEKWYELTENSCKLIYDEAKARFEEFASESESITNKSIKILSVTFSLAAFLLAYAFSHSANIISFIILGIAVIIFVWELVLLFVLIAPKDVRFRGVDVGVSFKKEIMDEENKEYQIQATYFTVIKALKENADFMFDKNNTRASKYETALVLLFTFVLLIGTYIGITLSHL